ncbi:hypothetical protein Jann_2911 [Jannaschia sp. CCS1]|nr:hypothetical protein Jann_2911 [Jannaschia sp. CCS1]
MRALTSHSGEGSRTPRRILILIHIHILARSATSPRALRRIRGRNSPDAAQYLDRLIADLRGHFGVHRAPVAPRMAAIFALQKARSAQVRLRDLFTRRTAGKSHRSFRYLV